MVAWISDAGGAGRSVGMQRNLRRKLCTELGFPRVWDLRYRFIFFMWLIGGGEVRCVF